MNLLRVMIMCQGMLLLLIVLSGDLPAQAPATGTITGTIRYVGEVPPNQRILTTDGQVIIHNDVVVQPKTKGLRDVAVVLDWKGKAPLEAKAKPVVIDQRDMVFMPRVVSAREGQPVRFENNDICNHAVQAHSIHKENVFNITTPPNRAFEHPFKTQKNPVMIGCPIHGWMRAWVIVAPHPYHAVSDTQGKFRIEHVPAGKHTLLLVHPDTNHRDQISVEMQAGKTAEIAIDWTQLKK